MAFFHSYKAAFGLFTFAILLVSSSAKQPQLDPNFYDKRCPKLLRIVKEVLNDTITKNNRMGASLLRLHFHDCFVNGCDGSILLDDPNGEQFASPNVNSIRGYEVIDRIKRIVEDQRACSGKVSCADILALAARESVVMLHGPGWVLGLGRRDSRNSNQKDAQNDLPSPSSNLSELITKFKNVNLDEKDLVALSGAHTIGKAQCNNFRDRIYNETTDIDKTFAYTAKQSCPRTAGSLADHNLEALDDWTPDIFDHLFFKNVANKRALLHSDNELRKDKLGLVDKYSNNKTAFFNDFASAMQKMSSIKPLTGSQGEIRNTCSKRNK